MGSIFAVHSFRGGTGKSNITANLAYCCANKGVRVGVVDTDIQSPGIHVIFGLEQSQAKYCLNDYLKGDCGIKDPVYDVSSKLNLSRGSINLVPSRLDAEAIVRMLKEGFDVPRLSRALSDLIRELQLGVLLVDTHPGIEEDTLLSIAMCDALLVILRPDEQDYQGTAVTFEIAKKMQVPQTFLIANRVPAEVDVPHFRSRLEEAYRVPVIGVLPFSYGLMTSQSRNVHSYVSPDDPFSIAIREVAEKMLAFTH